VLSIGVPVGLGVYLAWVDRSSSAAKVGFCASLLGALLGAGLGFQAGNGLLAVVTTIAGAGVGANLLLLGVDIWLGTPAREAEGRAAARTGVGGAVTARR
jgi:hypothetical protein